MRRRSFPYILRYAPGWGAKSPTGKYLSERVRPKQMLSVGDLPSLILQAKQGDVEAYSAIVRRFQDTAVGYAYGILGNHDSAKDAAQEAFIEAYACLGELREPRAFSAWFRRIIFKQCDRITRRRSFTELPLDD